MATDLPPRPNRVSAVVALLLLAPVPTIGVTCAMYLLPGPAGRVVFTIAKIWLVAFPGAWYLVVERGTPSWSPVRRGGLATGTVVGIATATVIVAGYWGIVGRLVDPDAVRRAAVTMDLASPARFALAAAGWIFINSVIEEYVYRWFILRELRVLMVDTAAVFGSAAIFTVHHVVAMNAYLDSLPTLLGSIGVFVGGAVWSWLYLRYASIWPGWVSHALADVAVFAVGWRLLFG